MDVIKRSAASKFCVNSMLYVCASDMRKTEHFRSKVTVERRRDGMGKIQSLVVYLDVVV